MCVDAAVSRLIVYGLLAARSLAPVGPAVLAAGSPPNLSGTLHNQPLQYFSLDSPCVTTMARLATTVIALSCMVAAVSGHGGEDKGGHGAKIRPGDARSIQAALDAAPPGTTVTIPAARYIVREPLIVRKNDVTIVARRGKNLGPSTVGGTS